MGLEVRVGVGGEDLGLGVRDRAGVRVRRRWG